MNRMKLTTMRRGRSARRLVRTRDTTPDDAGLSQKITSAMKPMVLTVVMMTSSHGNECRAFGVCHTGAASSGAGVDMPFTMSTLTLQIFFRR